MKVVQFPERERQIVPMLERLLERARAGEIRSIGVAVVLGERRTATEFDLDYGDHADVYLALIDLAERIREHRE